MAFDRHGERVDVPVRKRALGEVDRDDLLLPMLRAGGEATPPGEKERRPTRLGSVTADVWDATLEASGGKPTTAQAIGALMTRRPTGFSVRMDPYWAEDAPPPDGT